MTELIKEKAFQDCNNIDEVVREIASLEKGDKIYLCGLEGSAPSFFVSLLFNRCKRPIILIMPEVEAERFHDDLSFFIDSGRLSQSDNHEKRWMKRVVLFPSQEVLPYEKFSPYGEIDSGRMEVLYRLCKGESLLLITTPRAIMQKVMDRESLLSSCEVLALKDAVDRDNFIHRLIKRGYRKVDMVEERGDLSVRGGIVDIFSPLYTHPLRIEFFCEEIESIRTFDIDSQRSIEELDKVVILPSKTASSHSSTLLEYIQPESIVCIKDRALVWNEAKRFEDEVIDMYKKVKYRKNNSSEPSRLFSSFDTFRSQLNNFGSVYFEYLSLRDTGKRSLSLVCKSNEDIRREMLSQKKELPFETLAYKIRGWMMEGLRVVFIVRSSGQKERLGDIFKGYGIQPRGIDSWADVYIEDSPYMSKNNAISITIGRLAEGFRLPQLGIVLITEEEIFGRKIIRGRPPSKKRTGALLSSLEEIDIGDLIVHTYHGIGIYRGLKRLRVEDEEGDYIHLEYAGGDKLYLPAYKLSMVQRYIGGDGAKPPLDKLGGTTWEKTQRKVKKAAEKVAKELLEIYAARKALKGFSFSRGDRLFHEFEASFEYEETPDQRRVIEEVLHDMESEKPMDRLVCGDVGYGKTEIALRASFKVVLDNKQVAFLVPTTVLAQQHYETFKYRFAPYPVNVEVLSRFKRSGEQKDILRRLAKGEIDILIGTHRLLQKDVVFKDLGLVIIDEEQRFGVAHKERLKSLRRLVDVLTLTATPIPRTLQMGLSGIRDLSIISTPPEDRLAIKTFISRFDKDVIREAILREIDRGGQVFFVHNRVKSIYDMAKFLGRLVPEIRIGIAHGQMNEDALEKVMWEFLHKKYDLLLTTVLIESGLDMPRVNTIIIDRADMFGLAQLYQLRGRVGRSHHRAYAYLLIPGDSALTDEGRKRLKAIEEMSTLGSGFTVATRDLEIRGAGELLGTAQSGNIALVGLDMYTKLLEEAVKKLKGEESIEEIDPEIKVSLPCYLPRDYIPNERQRLFFYKRLASARELQDIYMIKEELRDRYGDIPYEGMNILGMMELKVLGKKMGIREIEVSRYKLTLSFDSSTNGNREDRSHKLTPQDIISFLNRNHKKAIFSPDQRLMVRFDDDIIDPINEARSVLFKLSGSSMPEDKYLSATKTMQ